MPDFIIILAGLIVAFFLARMAGKWVARVMGHPDDGKQPPYPPIK